MNFELYTQVALLVDVPKWNLCKGDIGTIVDKHPGPPNQEAGYSIEVFNVLGDTVAVFCLSESDIEPLHDDEVFQKRQLVNVAA